MISYRKTLDWMFRQLPMYQNKGKNAFKKDLTNIRKLSKLLGDPQQSYPTIHVGGTNGKGSTSHMLASVLQESGYKTGLYTSPHLVDFRERIKVNGEKISEDFVVGFISDYKQFLSDNQLSFFEMSVGMAFMYFNVQSVDIAIIEVGLGGRLDSTNIIRPILSVITNVSFDHMDILGDSLPLIASEKAGIIKKETPVIIGEHNPETDAVFFEEAKRNRAQIIFAEDVFFAHDFTCDLQGNYQEKNLCTSLATLAALKKANKDFSITRHDIRTGLKNVIKKTGFVGRWQIIDNKPLTICDTAHNEAGIRAVVKQLNTLKKEHLHLVLGFVKDKEVKKILSLFPQDAFYYFAAPNVARKMPISVLKKQVTGLESSYYPSIGKALKEAKQVANDQDIIFIGGSTFVVAEVLKEKICEQ